MQPDTSRERENALILKFKDEIGDELRLTRADMWEYLGEFCGFLYRARLREEAIREHLEQGVRAYHISPSEYRAMMGILENDAPPDPGPSYGSLAP